MRFIGSRLPLLAGLLLAMSSLPARAQVLYWETSDWVPTASALAMPTSYLVGSTYVLPTAYTIPTVYATAYATQSALLEPTTFLTPTYYETRFRRRGLFGLFGRRYVETSRAYYVPTTAYYPTTYYYPTTFYSPTVYSPTVMDRAVISTAYSSAASTECCGTMVATNLPEVRTVPAERAPLAAPPPSTSRPRSAPIQSQAADEDTFDSKVPELPTREATNPPQRPTNTQKQPESPPAPQVPVREQSTAAPNASTRAPSSAAAPGTGAQPQGLAPRTQPSLKNPAPIELPTAPAGDAFDDLRQAPNSKDGSGSSSQRSSQKPVYSTTRALRSEYRNVLFGRVKARDNSEPEEGVRVTITNRTNAYADRVALTDAFGRFAVKVPDGDWTVNVTMPSGRSYAVSEITVSNGLISDDIGRDIPSLVITR